MKIRSVIQFMEWKHKMFEENPFAQMFRGQLNSNWKLIPSIARYAEKCVEQGYDVNYGYDSLVSMESHLIQWFEKYSMPFKDYRTVPYTEKLVHAQHYGLPTRLLDWTTNPLKALYFAVENSEFDFLDGRVYGLTPTGWYEQVETAKLDSKLTAFFPELVHERLNAQEGCFTMFLLPKYGFNVLPLTKKNYSQDVDIFCSVQVDAKFKREIRQELSQLGINHRTIYPGLEGIAKWVKSDLSNYFV